MSKEHPAGHTHSTHDHDAHEHEAHGHSHGPHSLLPRAADACARSAAADRAARRVLTIRLHSGLAGDMFLAGLLRLTGLAGPVPDELPAAVMPELTGSVRLVRKEVAHVTGWHAEVTLPHQHAHRTLADIMTIIGQSGMSEEGKRLSGETFALLARAEGAVHGIAPGEVHFHEVGALDSILDICLTCELFAQLAPAQFVASPVPLADGGIACAHGVIPLPAPAVLELLEGVPVRPFPVEGETVTPTAMALLRTLEAEFGPWPCMRVERQALVYGSREFPGVPNGALFALGRIEGESA